MERECAGVTKSASSRSSHPSFVGPPLPYPPPSISPKDQILPLSRPPPLSLPSAPSLSLCTWAPHTAQLGPHLCAIRACHLITLASCSQPEANSCVHQHPKGHLPATCHRTGWGCVCVCVLKCALKIFIYQVFCKQCSPFMKRFSKITWCRAYALYCSGDWAEHSRTAAWTRQLSNTIVNANANS